MPQLISSKNIYFDPKTLSKDFSERLDREKTVPLSVTRELLGQKITTLTYSEKLGLRADVRLCQVENPTEDQIISLPVEGVPLESTNTCDFQKVMRAIQHSFWTPVKNEEGRITKVVIRPSLKGGMQGKIPFQDGLSLGSIVRGSVIAKMDRYSKQLAEIESYEEQINSANHRMKAIEMDDSRASKMEKGQLVKFIENTEGRIVERLKEPVAEIPVFSTFQVAMRSPIDLERSTYSVQPRGFDSLKFGSKYISLQENKAQIEDQINQASSSFGGSTKGGWGLFSVGASASWAKSASDRINTIKKSERGTGVLLVNANLTTRNVRCFNSLKYDLRSLESFVKIMEEAPKENKEEYLDKFGISLENGEPVIYMLTEAQLGGSFTAIVTFLSDDEMSRRAELRARERSRTVGIEGSYAGIVSVGGSYSSSSARQSESDLLQQTMSTRVEIEFVSQGAIPGFARDVIEKEVIQHLSLNPAEFSPSPSNKEQAKALVAASGKELATLETERRLRMEEAQVGVVNACRELASTKSTQKIHTAESVMGAYENFASLMTSDKDTGVPIGFNFTRLTLSEMKRELDSLKKEQIET